MSFEPENELEVSFMKAAADAAHRPQFYKDLAAAEIFFIRHGATPSDRNEVVSVAKGEPVQIRNMEFNGKQYLPIFTSLRRLQAVLDGRATYLKMNALEFFKLTQGTPLVLNPGSSVGKELTVNEVAAIIDGSIWQPTKN
jgi:hypothetical protein